MSLITLSKAASPMTKASLKGRLAHPHIYCPQSAPWPRVVDVEDITLAFVMQSLFTVKPFLASFLLITHLGLCNIFSPEFLQIGWTHA